MVALVGSDVSHAHIESILTSHFSENGVTILIHGP